MLNELQQEWAPLDDVVFHLTPPSFHAQAQTHYNSLDCPAISHGTFWNIYKALLGCFRESPSDGTLENVFRLANLGADHEMELLEGFRELHNGDEVVGDGVLSQGAYDAAIFSDDEDADGECEYYCEFSDDEKL